LIHFLREYYFYFKIKEHTHTTLQIHLIIYCFHLMYWDTYTHTQMQFVSQKSYFSFFAINVSHKEGSIFEIFSKWVIATFSFCPILLAVSIHELKALEGFPFFIAYLSIHVGEQSKICWKEDISLATLNKVSWEIFLFIRLGEFFRNDWCISTHLNTFSCFKHVEISENYILVWNVSINMF